MIKPQDLGIGKALKATVGLLACNGLPDICLEGMDFEGDVGLLSLDKVVSDATVLKTLVFVNKGTAPGFVCLKAFGDKDLKR